MRLIPTTAAWLLVLPAALGCADSQPAAVPPEAAARARPAPLRGTWVLAEGSQRVLEHPERIPRLIQDARQLRVTDLFVQVYRGGRAWFDSSHADAGPYRAARDASGRDPLLALIAQAHAAGLRVHAWVNALSLASNRDAPLLRELGSGVAAVDRFGRSVLDYPNLDVPEPDRSFVRMGTPAVWLDPAAPGVEAALARTFAELASRYPELDGLHLDYIRYPDVLPFSPGSRFGVGLDFGYGEATRARFRQETGLEAPFGHSLRNANRWDHWRRERLTTLVAGLRRAVREAAPHFALSAAVWTYADRAYLSLGQDWRRWLEDGLLEFAVAMAYTRDDRLLRYQVESFSILPVGPRIWIGLGSWLFESDPARAARQIRLARTAGAAADVLFSYDSIAAAPELRSALIQAVSDVE